MNIITLSYQTNPMKHTAPFDPDPDPGVDLRSQDNYPHRITPTLHYTESINSFPETNNKRIHDYVVKTRNSNKNYFKYLIGDFHVKV